MQEKFVKEEMILNKLGSDLDLRQCIKNSKIKLEEMRANFNNVESELADYYIYMIKAEEAKCDYLIKKAKEILEENKE